MIATITQRAEWDDTHRQIDGHGPIQTGHQQIAVITCDGVEFKSWLPKSREHAELINAAAEKLTHA